MESQMMNTQQRQMLTIEQIEEFRQRVDAELSATIAAIAGDGDAIVQLDQTSVGRLSRMDAMQQQAMASGIKERLLVKKRRLEAARIRLDADEFGYCCLCGDVMSIERLQADLGTPFCAACQDEIDERHKSQSA
jgi:DnaK suppressor protein